MFTDIQVEIELFFHGLNWTFIFIYVMCLYGIKNNEEFDWYNALMDRYQWLKKLKIWIAGVVVAIIFCYFTWKGGVHPVDSEYISALMRSWIIVIVFNTVANRKINQSIKDIDKKEDKKS